MKKYNCPECYSPLNEFFSCENGHHFSQKEGILSLFSQKEAERAAVFLEKFQAFREKSGLRITEESLYPQLPFVQNGLAGTSWKARAFDLKYIFSQLEKNKSLEILEIGAWNGWLSHQLAEAGHDVTAIDIFMDKYDGLAAMQFYPQTWNCLQMDIEEVDKLISAKFDLIILNWGAAYISDLPLYVDKLKTMLKEKGKIIFIGIAVYLNPTQKATEIAAFNAVYKAEYGTDLFFKPCKGYLTWEDKKKLEKKGVKLKLYPFWRSQLRALLMRKGAVAFYGRADFRR